MPRRPARSRRATGIALLALAATGAALTAAPAASAAATHRDPCVRHATRVMQRTTAAVRIFVTRNGNGIYACARATGRVTAMYRDAGVYTVGLIRSIQGPFVAYDNCIGSCIPGTTEHPGHPAYVVLDVRRGTRRTVDPYPARASLGADGALVSLAFDGPVGTLTAWDRGGVRVLDTGAIDTGSVRLAGGVVRWTAGGTAHRAAVAGAPVDTCAGGVREVIGTYPEVRIVRVRGGDAVYACSRTSGRLTPLYPEDDLYATGTVRAVSGRHVAYDSTEIPACKADCPPGVVTTATTAVVDALTGVRRVLVAATADVVRLTPSGAVAYLVGAPPHATLSAWDADGRRTLDHGAVAAASVVLTGTELRWSTGGVPHAATLR
jgi:hypothetical protein